MHFKDPHRWYFKCQHEKDLGLSVTEALWKGIPVIGRNVGGIPLQIINGTNGFLINYC